MRAATPAVNSRLSKTVASSFAAVAAAGGAAAAGRGEEKQANATPKPASSAVAAGNSNPFKTPISKNVHPVEEEEEGGKGGVASSTPDGENETDNAFLADGEILDESKAAEMLKCAQEAYGKQLMKTSLLKNKLGALAVKGFTNLSVMEKEQLQRLEQQKNVAQAELDVLKESLEGAKATLEWLKPVVPQQQPGQALHAGMERGGGMGGESKDKFAVPVGLPRLVEGAADLELFHDAFIRGLYTHRVKEEDTVRCLLACLDGTSLPTWAFDCVKEDPDIDFSTLWKKLVDKYQLWDEEVRRLQTIFEKPIKQRSDETLQQYHQRFLTMMARVGIKENAEDPAREMNSFGILYPFIFGLRDSMAFFRRLHDLRINNGEEPRVARSAVVYSMRDVMQIAEFVQGAAASQSPQSTRAGTGGGKMHSHSSTSSSSSNAYHCPICRKTDAHARGNCPEWKPKSSAGAGAGGASSSLARGAAGQASMSNSSASSSSSNSSFSSSSTSAAGAAQARDRGQHGGQTTCFHCGEIGHMSTVCPARRRGDPSSEAGTAARREWSARSSGPLRRIGKIAMVGPPQSSLLVAAEGLGDLAPGKDQARWQLEEKKLVPAKGKELVQGQAGVSGDRLSQVHLIPIEINGVILRDCLLDSGAEGASFVNSAVVKQFGWETRPCAKAQFESASHDTFGTGECVIVSVKSRFGVFDHVLYVHDTGSCDMWVGTDLLPLLGIAFTGLQAHISRTLTPEMLRPIAEDQVPGDEARPPMIVCEPLQPDQAKEDEKNAAFVRSVVEAEMTCNEEKVTGLCNLPEAVVTLKMKPGTGPVNLPQYPLPHALHEAVDTVVADWEARGIVRRASPGTTWNNPITAVPKLDETGACVGTRVCSDLRVMNKNLDEGDSFPLPDIHQLLRIHGGVL